MRPRLDRPLAAVLDEAAPVEDPALCILRLQLQPDIEGVLGPSRKKMTDAARARHDVDAVGLAGAQERIGAIERGDQGGALRARGGPGGRPPATR